MRLFPIIYGIFPLIRGTFNIVSLIINNNLQITYDFPILNRFQTSHFLSILRIILILNFQQKYRFFA